MAERRLGSYDLLRRLGEGGMAQVYLARDIRLGREVAVKVLNRKLAERPGFRERFMREARVAAALDHPNIVPLYDFGEDHDLYLVMPYIRGGSLQDMLPRAPFPIGEVVTYGSQIADALEYAHQRKVVHRDVKPANMLAHADGRLMLSDFGLAKIVSVANTPNMPRNRPDAGTPEYMAPEQVVGSSDARSDIYGLGVVLFLLLTGRLPFSGPNAQDVMEAHLRRDPGSPRRYNPSIPPAMEAVVMRAMAKKPADRFQRASELGAALLSALIAGDDGSSPFVLGGSSHSGSRPTGQAPMITVADAAGGAPTAPAPDAPPPWRQRAAGISAGVEGQPSADAPRATGAPSTSESSLSSRSSQRSSGTVASALPDLNMPFTSLDPTHGLPPSADVVGGQPRSGAGANAQSGSWLSGGAFSFGDSQTTGESLGGFMGGRGLPGASGAGGPRLPLQETQQGPTVGPRPSADARSGVAGFGAAPGAMPGATPGAPAPFGPLYTSPPAQGNVRTPRDMDSYQSQTSTAMGQPVNMGRMEQMEQVGHMEWPLAAGAPTSVRLGSGLHAGPAQMVAPNSQSGFAPQQSHLTHGAFDASSAASSAGAARAPLPGVRGTEPPQPPLARERSSQLWIVIVALLIVLLIAVVVLLRWLEAGPAGFSLFLGS